MPTNFEVQRQAFGNCRVVETEAQPLQPGEVRLKVDFYAFTANNLTYAAAGGALGYWQFFPPSSAPDEVWGVIPVWGFADVVETTVDELAVGERLYGYFPPSEELIMQPVKIKADSLFDGIAHRAKLPPLYNRYLRVGSAGEKTGEGAAGQAQQEIAQALFGPLYMTSFCLFDQLKAKGWYDAAQIIVTSASSKTSIGLAYGLANDEAAPDVIGLTSASNADFVSSLGIYGETVTYDDLSAVPRKPTVVVDMAGNSQLSADLEAHLGDDMRYFIGVGLTHWDQNTGGLGRKSDRHEMFFAPSYMLERGGELPPGEFARLAQDYATRYSTASLAWLKLITLSGLHEFADRYPALSRGEITPAEGLICQL